MSFDAPSARRQSIAIVGAGISGMATARLLARQHEVTLFEAASRLGGHARTVLAGLNGDQPVDMGFIVFNYANYPHLTRMFADLDVPVMKSNMSFGASINGGQMEYGLETLKALFGQRRNLLRPGFLGMLRDIDRFNRRAVETATCDAMTVSDLIGKLGLGSWFERYYLLPICGAIWSSPSEDIGGFPARALVRFFANHALLSVTGQHQWWTVQGGSIEYVRRLERDLIRRGVALRPSTPVQAVTRLPGQAWVKVAGAPAQGFDHVIFACHSDIALRLLQDARPQERVALAAIRYQDNHAVLHRDPLLMPRRKACWSAWNYQADERAGERRIGVTYWMNRLQDIPASDPLFLTLNPAKAVNEAMVYDEIAFRHPVLDAAALAAQAELAQIQGRNNTWFAGAYLRNGFHEDGYASAVRIARRLEPVFA